MNPKPHEIPRRSNAREKLLDAAFDLVYIHGYAATSVDMILKTAGVPKGSLYHHFGSKKALVTAMIRERLFPRIDRFFPFRRKEGCGVTESIRDLYAAMARNRPLISYGCPLYRLMVELSPVDGEFDALLLTKYRQLHADLAALLREGIERGEYCDALDAENFAATMLSATWGALSLSPSISSPENFLAQTHFLLESLEGYRR
jgi:TetR/AcrR family transcriptional repressor of nem operon